MSIPFFKKIDNCKYTTLDNFKKEITEKSIQHLESQMVNAYSDNEKWYNLILTAKIEKLKSALKYNEYTDYPIDISVIKLDYFMRFSNELDLCHLLELLSIIPKTVQLKISPDTLTELSSNKKILWYQPINCGITKFPWIGYPLRVPAALLSKLELLPKEIQLIDENDTIIDINKLIIPEIHNLDTLSSDSLNNQAKLIFKYFKKIYGAPDGCSEETWSNTGENAYRKRLLSDLETLNKYIPITQINVEYPKKSKDRRIPKEKVIKSFSEFLQGTLNIEMDFQTSNDIDLLSVLKKNPEYAKFFYLIKLYTLYKISGNYNINTISEVAFKKQKVPKGTLSRKNFETILKILFDKTTPDTVIVYGKKHTFTDNNSIAANYTTGSGNGQIFDELYTLLLLNRSLSTTSFSSIESDILLFQFIWQSRIYAEQLNILSAIEAPLENYLNMYIKQWIVRAISFKAAFDYQHKEPQFLPIQSIYCLGKMHQLHSNKHTSFTQYLKIAILRLFKNNFSKSLVPYEFKEGFYLLSTNDWQTNKSYIERIDNFFRILKNDIPQNIDLYLELFKDAIKQTGLDRHPLYKNLQNRSNHDTILDIIINLPKLRATIFPKPLSDENSDATAIENGLKYIYPFLINYPSDFYHTKESQEELIYVACIALYISCNYISPYSQKSPIHLKQKSLMSEEDKNLIKLRSILALLTKNSEKNCFKLLYPLSSSYPKRDLIPISPYLGVVNILDIPALSHKPELIKEKSIVGTDITLAKSIIAFYIILFATKLYSDKPSEFANTISIQRCMKNRRGAGYAFEDITDLLDVFRLKD